MDETILNAVVTLRNEVSPWLMILQVVPDGWMGRHTLPHYVPGQFTSLGLFGSASRCALAEPEMPPADPDKLIKRAYSIVSSPGNHEFLEFYVALVPVQPEDRRPYLDVQKGGRHVYLRRFANP